MAIEFPKDKFVNDTFEYGGLTYVWDGEKWTASGAAAFEDVYVNIEGDQMTGNLTVPSLNEGPLAGLRNQLINGDFLVWQRGSGGIQSPGSNGTSYGPDRWRLGGATVQNIGRTRNAPIGHNYAVTYDGPGQIQQRIELTEYLRGQYIQGSVWTLSFYSSIAPDSVVSFFNSSADGGGTAFTVTPPEEIEAEAAGFTRYACQITCDQTTRANDNSLLVSVTFPAAFIFGGAQLECGPVATPFEHRPVALELSLCQRYYFNRGNVSQTCAWRSPAKGPQELFPTTMRIPPTLSRGTIWWKKVMNTGSFAEKTDLVGLGSTITENGFTFEQDWAQEAVSLNASDVTFDAEL